MKSALFILAIIIMILYGCGTDSIQSPDSRISKISMNITGLSDPGDSVAYEAWLSWKDQSTQIDKVEMLGLLESSGGTDYKTSINMPQGNLQGGEYVYITMETNTEDSVASGFRILAANLYANSGDFRVGHKQVLNYDFENAQAVYFLDTPTEDPPSANPNSGIWFAHYEKIITDIPDSSGNVIGQDTSIVISQGLDLAVLPAGWMYEGFVIVDAETLSTGEFTSPGGADMSNQYSGPNPGPGFPGEDFLANHPSLPTDLRGRTVFIKLTPNYPDKGNMPYELIVFQATIPADAQANVNYEMENLTDNWPTGQLSTEITLYQ